MTTEQKLINLIREIANTIGDEINPAWEQRILDRLDEILAEIQ